MAYKSTNCSLKSAMTWHRASRSCRCTVSTFGSMGGLSRSSCGFTRLLRLNDAVAEGVSGLRGEGGAEGIKTGLAPLPPVREVVNVVSVGRIGTDADTVPTWLSCIKLEGIDISAGTEVVGDAVDVFELIVHLPPLSSSDGFNFLIGYEKIENMNILLIILNDI